MLKELENELRSLADPKRAAGARRFFKTGPGQYGAGDVFIGLTVPDTRRLAKKYQDLGWNDLDRLLKSKIHEFRLAALFILIARYQKAGDPKLKKRIFDFYYARRRRINSWDLVDISAPNIFGDYLLVTKQGISRLLIMAKSKDLWERRIAMIATFSFIKAGRSEEALQVAARLLHDRHDLIHKALGWMLRELGKRVGQDHLTAFLDREAAGMPRTALRYAIERLPTDLRAHYLRLKKVGIH